MSNYRPPEPERTFARALYSMLGWMAGFLLPYGIFYLASDGRDYLGHERLLLFMLGAVMAIACESAVRGVYDLVTEMRRP